MKFATLCTLVGTLTLGTARAEDLPLKIAGEKETVVNLNMIYQGSVRFIGDATFKLVTKERLKEYREGNYDVEEGDIEKGICVSVPRARDDNLTRTQIHESIAIQATWRSEHYNTALVLAERRGKKEACADVQYYFIRKKK